MERCVECKRSSNHCPLVCEKNVAKNESEFWDKQNVQLLCSKSVCTDKNRVIIYSDEKKYIIMQIR